MGTPYRLAIRHRGRTEKHAFDDLAAALDALETELRAAATGTNRTTERALLRELEPVQQVAVRGELAGPRGMRAGIDVRGDGSTEAFTGRITRRLVEQRPGEDAFAALRRALGGG
ncbi:MAG: hypothetical protein HZB46_13405 [Solirubrobacterales bacterium]|nr:hypothetical protein [Solirubrobacterales bacterium]